MNHIFTLRKVSTGTVKEGGGFAKNKTLKDSKIKYFITRFIVSELQAFYLRAIQIITAVTETLTFSNMQKVLNLTSLSSFTHLFYVLLEN